MRVPFPELTPSQKTLNRVLAISRFNGWSVAIFGGLGLVLALGTADWVGSLVSLVVVAAGWLELRGHAQLQRCEPAGMKTLVQSQLLLLALLLTYCASRVGNLEATQLSPDLEAVLKQGALKQGNFFPAIRGILIAFYVTLGLTAVVYQGGLALYYWSKTPKVREALRHRSF